MTESTMKLTFNLEKFRNVVNEAADSDEIVMSKEEALLFLSILENPRGYDLRSFHGDKDPTALKLLLIESEAAHESAASLSRDLQAGFAAMCRKGGRVGEARYLVDSVLDDWGLPPAPGVGD